MGMREEKGVEGKGGMREKVSRYERGGRYEARQGMRQGERASMDVRM
jgi:hypothetical protein